MNRTSYMNRDGASLIHFKKVMSNIDVLLLKRKRNGFSPSHAHKCIIPDTPCTKSSKINLFSVHTEWTDFSVWFGVCTDVNLYGASRIMIKREG